METLRRRVSDHNDGCAGRTVEGVTDRCLSLVSVGGHLEKIGQWGVGGFGMDPMTVHCGYDGPSSGSHSVIQ